MTPTDSQPNEKLTNPVANEETFPPMRVLASEELFTGGREVLIRHKKDTYRLKITKAGKLILNK